MFNNMCGPNNKEHNWNEIDRPRPTLATETSGYFSDQLESVPTPHFNHEHFESYSNVLYSHNYINDSPNNLQGGNRPSAWQYMKPRPTGSNNYLCRSKPANREDGEISSPRPMLRPTTEMHIDSSDINKSYIESDITPCHRSEQNIRSTRPQYTDDRGNCHQISKSDGTTDMVALSSTLLNCEPCVIGEKWVKCDNNVNTGHEKTIPVELGPVLEGNLSTCTENEVIKDKCKYVKGVSDVPDSRITGNGLCEMSRSVTQYRPTIQNDSCIKTVQKRPSEDEYEEDPYGESSSGGDSDESSLSSGVAKINCRDAKRGVSMNHDEEDPSEEDASNISSDNIEQQIANFYQLICVNCDTSGSEKQTFSSHKLLSEHCREKHGSEGEIKCCGHSMCLKEELLEHMQEHKVLFWCAKCQITFVNKTLWKKHMHQHEPKSADVGPYCCPHCEKKFSSKYGLSNHLNLHLPEDERPFKCRHCNKGFGAKHAMSKHERTHLPDEERLSYVCDKCGKRFGYASTLDGHQKHVHQNERPFVCHICAKTFPIKGALTYHLTTHEVQDRMQCSNCGIWLKNKKILRIHKKCHQGNLYACPHCDKVSNTRNNLRMHMKRHSDARPHPCPLCARAFKTPRDLKTHMVQHTGQKPYSCPYCPKAFASPSNFYAHRKMKHKMATPALEDTPSTISNLQSY